MGGKGRGYHRLRDVSVAGHARSLLDTMVDLHEAIALYNTRGYPPAQTFYDLAPDAAPAIRCCGKDLSA